MPSPESRAERQVKTVKYIVAVPSKTNCNIIVALYFEFEISCMSSRRYARRDHGTSLKPSGNSGFKTSTIARSHPLFVLNRTFRHRKIVTNITGTLPLPAIQNVVESYLIMTIIRSRLQRSTPKKVEGESQKEKKESANLAENRLSQIRSLRSNGIRRRPKSSRKRLFINYFISYGWVGLTLIIVWLGGFYFVYHFSSSSSPTPQEIKEILRADEEDGMSEEQGDDEAAHEEPAKPQEFYPKPKPKYQPQQLAKSNLRSILGKTGTSGAQREVIDMRDLNKNLPFDNPSGGESTLLMCRWP